MVDTTDEWIMTRIGIKERRYTQRRRSWAPATWQCMRLTIYSLRKQTPNPHQVDMLICGVVTPDMQFPATANIISDKCGITNAFGYDLNAGCSSFLYALVTASKFVESGSHKKVIVVGADKMSSITDYTDQGHVSHFWRWSWCSNAY
jgi:3-oxoacyl-[acyl-carrier-protein] synthase III